MFGTPVPSLPVVFNFRGSSDSLVELKFGAVENVGSGVPSTNEEKRIGDSKKLLFSIGTVSGKNVSAQKVSRNKRLGGKKSSPKNPTIMKDLQADQEETLDTVKQKEHKDQHQSLARLLGLKKQALSPAVAECQRAVFATFLWQERLVDDAIASASHLMRNPSMVKLKCEQKFCDESLEKESVDKADDNYSVETKEKSSDSAEQCVLAELPPTLNHLVTFWEEISSTIVENSNVSFSPPVVPGLAQELLKQYEEEKIDIEKRRKEKDKKVASAGGGAGSTMCELCNLSFSDPVTYHMKDSHPGCGRHASGWGYNSKGTFCSGWAGNCGDGGRGGSTWYLMCKSCHSKYLTMKDETKKKVVKLAPLSKMKTRKPGKPRNLPPITAVRCMTQNAKFLLEIDHVNDSTPTTPLSVHVPAVLNTWSVERQLSSPHEIQTVQRKDMQGESFAMEILHPALLRSKSVAVEKLGADEKLSVASQIIDDPLMSKPSKNLRQLMYNRSKQGNNNKESGYNRVMGFLLCYHDLDGLRACMKQSMRVAGIRSYALKASI